MPVSLLENRFEYPKLVRKATEHGRRYVSPLTGQPLPSVTTILDQTKSEESKAGLEKWRKRIGRDNAKAITLGAANLGTVIHNQLEKYIKGEELVWGNNMIQIMARKMVETVIAKGISRIEKVYGLEVGLVFEGLYAGTADLIIQADGEILIADFKNTIKMKKEEWIGDYYMQMVAYALAHNEMFGTNINKGRVMMVARPNENTGECQYMDWEMTEEKFKEYEEKWLQKLEQYYAQN